MLTGKLVELTVEQRQQAPGCVYGFEYLSYSYNMPECIKHVWPLINVRCTGMSWFDEKEALGKEAQDRDGNVSVYMGQGNWLNAQMPQGGSTKAVSVEVTIVPCPKVRKGIERRWHDGRWQKYLKASGWVNA